LTPRYSITLRSIMAARLSPDNDKYLVIQEYLSSLDYIEIILRSFPIDIDSTRRVYLNELAQDTRLYEVDVANSPLLGLVEGQVYLIDTPSGRRIACHPHLVAEKLSLLCFEAAKEFALALKELELTSGNSGILHILRGGLGYRVDKVLPQLPVINIRTQYRKDGYRAHSDDSRRIDVTYSDYHQTTFDSLIVPDTYATGRSVEAALQHMFEMGLSVENVIIYGFIAASGVERVYNLLAKHGVHLYVFAICDISQLYSNNYDMPLYGLDEHLYKQKGVIKPLGSIVAPETLRDMIPHYVPGMDQPGDWSERHTDLYNGYNNESGDIREHLRKSIELIKSLNELNSQQPWYTEHIHDLAQKEIKNCRKLL
jgi:uracil phosphoribosyltransferase